MDPQPLSKITAWADGDLTAGDGNLIASGVCTDSRKIQKGDLFIALRGENFDGHDFIPKALECGAVGAIVDTAPAGYRDFAIIRVKDTLHALQQIAACYRNELPLRVIAVTGSNGKTSTKDFIAAMLGREFRVVKTEGNLNNHIGLPLSILSAKSEHQAGVFEIGMNHPGEIAPLARIAAPQVAVITNIGIAHIEFLGSREAIAQEKGMLAEAVPADGVLVLNADDPFSDGIAKRTRARVITAGLESGDLCASNIQLEENGVRFVLTDNKEQAHVHLSVTGLHMVSNALLAAATGQIFGLSLQQIAEGLAEVRLTKGRLEQKIIRGIRIIDDSYNANPDSMIAALRTLAHIPATGRRIAVLGKMGELGLESERGHRQVGETAGREGISCVVGVGESSDLIVESARSHGVGETFHVGTATEAAKLLQEMAHAGDVVLVKGSRSARMERIVEELMQK
jgi:UDP-N-acetylmuramoyl-tripeptide--D-alanyl-D-alanine ligase